MSRLFDPTQLLSAPLPENATRRDPLPAGEVCGQITKIGFSSGTSNKPGQPKQDWTRLDCSIEITDPEYCSQIEGNPEKCMTTLGVMLDMRDNQIAYGPNVNVRLGRLREATGTNGKPLDQMVGQWLRLSIGHKPHPKDDGTPDTEFYGVILDEIVNYTKV